MLVVFITLTALIAGLFLLFNFQGRIKNFPPGPPRFPLLGHIPLLGFYPHETLKKWKKTYGNVIGLWFGSYRAVVLNDGKLIREALQQEVFAGRPNLNLFFEAGNGRLSGIIMNYGPHWKEQRRFTIKNLRDFGFGTKSMEHKIQMEISELLIRLESDAGKPVQAKNLFHLPALNSLWNILFSKRLPHDDPDTLQIIRRSALFFEETSMVASLGMLLPWLSKSLPKFSGFDSMLQSIRFINSAINKHVIEHNKDYTKDQPRDFIDAYMDEVENVRERGSSFHSDNKQLIETLRDIFFGGSETTSSTLVWICAYMTLFPEVQTKLQKEIDQVIGPSRLPALADQPHMPYVEAVIHEVLRFSSIFPQAFPHNTTEDVTFHGFFIPKNTMIIPNLYAVHFDEELWDQPKEFRPERFLDSKGEFVKNPNLIPFSVGKRLCPGESLGRMQLFLFITSLLQRFEIRSSGKAANLTPKVGVTLPAQPFEIVFSVR